MSEFTIRGIEGEDDAVFVRGLNRRLCDVIEAPTHSNEEVVAFQDRFTASACDAGAGESTTFVAVDGSGKRLGYVNVRESADEIANQKCAYIALLAVTAEAEGKGVGQSLVLEAEKWAKQMGFVRLALDVFESNHRGRHFYEESGFRPETVRLIKQV